VKLDVRKEVKEETRGRRLKIKVLEMSKTSYKGLRI
jgi:hypothetical protein